MEHKDKHKEKIMKEIEKNPTTRFQHHLFRSIIGYQFNWNNCFSDHRYPIFLFELTQASPDTEYGGETHVRRHLIDNDLLLNFMSKVLDAYPSGTITMVLDNVRIHHAKLLEPFLI